MTFRVGDLPEADMRRHIRRKRYRNVKGRNIEHRDKYPVVGPTDETLAQRAHQIVECLRLFPHEIALPLARYPEAAWVFGRLYLVGALTYDQYNVADRLSRVTRRYRRLLAPHCDVKAFNPASLKIHSFEDLSLEAQKRLRAAQEKYEKYYHVLEKCGQDVVDSIFGALDTDMIGETDLALIRRGLTALMTGR